MATISVRWATRKYAVAAAVLVSVPFAVIAYRLALRGSLPAATAIAKPPPFVRMDVEVTSPTAGAMVKIAGQAHQVPFSGEVEGGTSPIVVELTAPEHEGRTFRIVFDRPRRLAFALPGGAGMVDATPEEHEHAFDDQVLVMRPSNAASTSSAGTPSTARPSDIKPAGTGSAAATVSVVAAVTAPNATAEPPPTVGALVPPPSAAPVVATAAVPSPKPETAAPPAVSAAPPGTIDPKAVRATVRAHASDVQTCYDRAKLDVPDLKGRLTVEASVNGIGRVQSARVAQSDVRSSRLEGCIVSAFQGWAFPAPSGGVPGTVKYTFVFQD